MSENKRTTEASSLRLFFDEQIDHLQTLFNGLNSYLEEIQQEEKDDQIIENFVDASNNKMRAVQGYADKLRIYVRALYSHVLEIAEQIPEPIDLEPNAFRTNALINALFVNYQDVEKLLSSNPEVNTFLHSYNDVPVLYAVLTAKRYEKPTLGIAMQGDMLVRDVLQHEVNFSSHKLHTPRPSTTELNIALKTHLFNRVVSLIKQEMDAQIKNQPFHLHNSYEARVNSLANPDVYLKTLIQYMENPAELLGIEKTHFKLNKLGIKLEDDDTQNANEFDIHELIWRDNIRVVVLQISHPR